jgi:MoxR-like ATPase
LAREAVFADPALTSRLARRVVGRRRELEVVTAALAAGRHVLLEGPPGTGKSTLLRTLAEEAGLGFAFVEGNAELTPARLVGHHDPSKVLAEGYRDETFVEGPLALAMREGALLYLEEINRIPEETLNVLITVMSEGELHVPRLGRIEARAGFRLVAAMNPFDTIGTARISSAIYDRTCRVLMDYQGPDEEAEVVRRAVAEQRRRGPQPPGGTPGSVRPAPSVCRTPGSEQNGEADLDPDLVGKAVELVRRTRNHPDIRVGSSVRGAIDLVLVAERLADLRETSASDLEVAFDAALAALSGRVRLHEGAQRRVEDVLAELFAQVFATVEPRAAPPPNASEAPPGPGKASAPAGGTSPAGA